MSKLTHFDEQGASRMVDVGGKAITPRSATASGLVRMQPATLSLIMNRQHSKGDVLEVARLAGIMGAKKTGDLIPLCHPLSLDSISLTLEPLEPPEPLGEGTLIIKATATITAKTGVEMEALTAVSVAALTVYDMCKAVDRGMSIERVQLEHKSGGTSGEFTRSGKA